MFLWRSYLCQAYSVSQPADCLRRQVRLPLERVTRIVILAIMLFRFALAFCTAAGTNGMGTKSASVGNRFATQQLSEQLRTKCIAERRSICGKILRVFPNGILVESGYTNLTRAPLTKSWLIPRTVTAARGENLVETREPGALCIGTVFLTDLPRGKPHQYDYVVIAGYPTGEFGYTSVGSVRKTVRRFSANPDKAARTNLAALQESR
jgi:hypothetical protein